VAFSIVLLLSFASIGIIVNIAVRQFIQNSAVSQLDAAYENMVQFIGQTELISARQTGNISDFFVLFDLFDVPFNYSARQNTFRIRSNMFIIDDQYNLPHIWDASDEVHEIVLAIKDENTNLPTLRNLLIRSGSGIYYISAFKAPDTPMMDNSYFVIYADVTGLLSFARTINTLLVVVVCIMFIITVIITFFLSKTITRPINKLNNTPLCFTPVIYLF